MSTAVLERMRDMARKSLRKKGPMCSVCALPPPILEAVHQLRSEGLPQTAICAALKGDGHVIRAYSMQRHFRDHEQG